jgi:acyl-CoA thioesterase
MSADSMDAQASLEGDTLLAEQVGAQLYKRDTAAHMLGIQLDAIGPGFARMSMPVRSDMLNGHGILHGGFTFSLADTAFAYACNSRNHKTVALACHISFVAPGHEGDVLVAVAQEQASAGKTGVYDIKITNQNGTVVAVFRGNSYRTGHSVVNAPV